MELVDIINAPDRVTGYKQVMRGLREGTVGVIALADDTDKTIKTQIVKECKARAANIIRVKSKVELGEKCGIEVSCAVIGCIKR
ncbi:MAG: ribosomal L7Ae/L30e/S12e/Gadd45 family protein [Firmicutes bacterium]|nr:ribosomal L7Ae/L30e/S12e/Gadd45 family protein [Bacillota bacterium]